MQVKTSKTEDFFVLRDAGEGDRLFIFVHVGKDKTLATYVVPGKEVNRIALEQTARFLERAQRPESKTRSAAYERRR